MGARRIRSKSLEKSQYRIYLKKAEEFYETMLQAQELDNWNAVGLNAVHCAISSADALLVFYRGIRSTEETHQRVVDLLLSLTDLPDIKSKASTLKRILAKKNIIAYEDRDFNRNDALEISKHAERFLNWVKSLLPKE